MQVACKICNTYWDSTVALGGHMSKAHPHRSEKYMLKQKKFTERYEERETFKEAKEIFIKETNLPYEKYRGKVTKIKNLMIEHKDDLNKELLKSKLQKLF